MIYRKVFRYSTFIVIINAELSNIKDFEKFANNEFKLISETKDDKTSFMTNNANFIGITFVLRNEKENVNYTLERSH